MVKIVPDRLRIHLPAQLFIHNRENPLFQFFIKISLVHIPRDTAGYQREEIVLAWEYPMCAAYVYWLSSEMPLPQTLFAIFASVSANRYAMYPHI